MRVIEIGCGPGAAARAVAGIVGPRGHVLAVDRSPAAIEAVERQSQTLIANGTLTAMCVSAENLVLPPDSEPYDLCFAARVGALDGRHPEAGKAALRRIAACLKPDGQLFIDGGDPLRRVALPR